jgi:hypothetical protein
MVYNTTQHPPKVGGGEVREKVEGEQYTSISSFVKQFTSWIENNNHEWMYFQSIKSVKHMLQSPLTGQF